MATFASLAATPAADDGISPSMVPSALLQKQLMVSSTWKMEIKVALKEIYTVYVKSKECVKKSTRAQYAWDSGLVTVLVTDLLMRKRVGTQCPGSTWKKYHPHRLEKADSVALLVGGLGLNSNDL